MKKRLLFIICFVFLLTGCDVDYNITINNDEVFDEKIVLSFPKSNMRQNDLLIYQQNKTPISVIPDETKFYNSEIVNSNSSYDLVYTYEHDIDSVKSAYFIYNCYPQMSIVNNDEEVVINSGDGFACFKGDDGLKADSVKINITTELNVINNNADEVVGNVYTWYINDSNYQNKTVEITLEKAFQIEDVLPQSEASYLTFIIVAVIVLVALIIILFVKHKAKKNNNI